MCWFMRLGCDSFDDAERDLDEVARSEGYSVQGVMELVHDYEDTMDAMKVSIPFATQHATPYLYDSHMRSLIISFLFFDRRTI
jgi:hypothetical protein